MRYVDFKAQIKAELKRNPNGLTWMDVRDNLKLPYNQPCPNWVKRMEIDIGLCRKKGASRAYVWTVEGTVSDTLTDQD